MKMNKQQTNSSTPEALRPFEFHGLELSINGTQAKTDCPFCEGSDKLFIAKDTGQYQCKRCDQSGNKYTFLTGIHQNLIEGTTDQQLKQISKYRNDVLPIDILKEQGIAMGSDGAVYLPCRSPGKPNLVNLRKWEPSTRINYNTPSCCSLFTVQWRDTGLIYICEGEWDGMALLNLMRRAKYRKIDEVSIVSVPGANTFKDSWIEKFKGRDVVLIYDNDHDKKQKGSNKMFNPAKDGMSRTTKLLGPVTNSIKQIDWEKVSTDLSDGYDISDHVRKAIDTKKSKLYLIKLLGACQSIEIDPSIKQIAQVLKRESFDEVVTDFQSIYHFDQSFIDTLACCIAAIVSLRTTGDPFWLFIVGPASSGKTSIIEAFEGATDQSEHMSKMSAPALVSGWGGNKNSDDDSGDPSMLPRLKDKVLFIKDFTAVLSMGNMEKEKLFGILRDAYDGKVVQHYGTGLTRSYDNLYFGIVAGVTHAIHGENRSSLGERFLKINIIGPDFDQEEHIRRALENVGTKNNNKALLQGSINGFLKFLKDRPIPQCPKHIEFRLTALSQLVSFIRTDVDRKNGREMSYRPEVEIGSRIATQLKKVGTALAMVYNVEEVNEDCYRVMQKVAFDSCIGWNLEIVQHLVKSDGMTRDALAERMDIHPNQVSKILEDCMQLGIVSLIFVKSHSKLRGRRALQYRLSDTIQQLIEDSKADLTTSQRTFSKRAKRSKGFK